MPGSSITLFPHTGIGERDFNKIQQVFGALTICQPWFMDGPLKAAKREVLSSLQIVRPPESLKPEGNFKGLLSEYRLWIKQNRDKGYTAFLNAIRESGRSEETPWEIRQMLKPPEGKASVLEKSHSLKWHLILHLAREFEENTLEGEEMLDLVKKRKSPLAQALGEDTPLQGLFEDLPQSEKSLFPDGHHLGQAIEAWVDLFGRQLKDHENLLTLDRNVLKHVLDIFKDGEGESPEEQEASFVPEGTSARTPFLRIRLPRLSDEKADPMDPIKKYLSGKTIIFLKD